MDDTHEMFAARMMIGDELQLPGAQSMPRAGVIWLDNIRMMTAESGHPLFATEALPCAERPVALVLLCAVAHLLATAVGEVESSPAVGARAAVEHGERELVRANAVASYGMGA